MAGPVLGLADAREAAGLAAYLDRLLRLDDRAAVRLQAGGTVLGVWSGPPLDVVALRPVALGQPSALDLTVSARRLREVTPDDGGQEVRVPAVVAGPSWVGLLPPRSGWAQVGRTSVGAVRDAVELARRTFSEHTEGVSERSALDAAADRLWERTVLGELPLRAAHAAVLLGFLAGPEDDAVVGYAAEPWLRLGCPGGSVLVRRGQSLPSLLAQGSLLRDR